MSTIKEVSAETGITAYTLRYYEKEGILPFVKRDRSGNRVYDEESLEWLKFVMALRSTGMPISEIKRYVAWYREGDRTLPQRKQMMLDHKAKVEETLRRTYRHLEQIQYKLALYDLQENKLDRLP